MIRKFLLAISIFASLQVKSQQNYFQQQVDYKINVSLDDENHILKGDELIHYTNNSKDTLKFLFFHLYPNAYKNDKSSFAAQEVENGQTKFYFSKEEQRGFIDSLDFRVNDNKVTVNNYNEQEDVVLLELNQPLLPAQAIDIRTSFRVVLPEVFSRLGHDGQNYQITQWYPKPAVYDVEGWHPMPYLDQGEFYSEFGNFEVNISTPSNYVIAATGELQTQSEKQFLKNRIEQKATWVNTKSNPLSETTFKTVQFKQSNVHDFAWFASKSFVVEIDTATLPTSEKVECLSYFKPENAKIYENSTSITVFTIEYLSKHVGKYPYAHASIVDGTLLAGGGMEYPMITVIGKLQSKRELQTVIIHEVGHNWFQGILASNERAHPWLDEGVNSFYESQIEKAYKKVDTTKTNQLADRALKSINENLIYALVASENQDQAIGEKSEDFSNMNYGAIVYKKAPAMLKYLQAYLGNEKFEQCMKKYFDGWKFKHPSPNDIQRVFERETAENLDWFFKDGIYSTKKIDYKLVSAKQIQGGDYIIRIARKKTFQGPVPISAMQQDSTVVTQWVKYPETQIVLNEPQRKYSRFEIDPSHQIPDLNMRNNTFRMGSLFHRMPIKIKPFTGVGLSRRRNIYVMPSIGYNYYDKYMMGICVHNISLPNSKFQFMLNPMFSVGTSDLAGNGVIGYSHLPNQSKSIHRIIFSLAGRSFHHNQSSLNIANSLHLRHFKITPSVQIDFKPPFARSKLQSSLSARYILLREESFTYRLDLTDSLTKPSIAQSEIQHFGHIVYRRMNKRTFNPFGYQLEALGNQEFLKIGFTANARVDYHMKDKGLHVRFYAGKFFDYKTAANDFALRNAYLNTTFLAKNDIIYDDVYLARNEQDRGLVQQISMREGGFKIRTDRYINPIGISDNWLTTLNLRSDLPIKMPIKLQVFADVGTFASASKLNPSQQKALFDAGLELHLFKDLLIIYAPFIMSKDFKDYTKQIYPKNRFLNTMSFALNLQQINFLRSANLLNVFSVN
jgi:hypothetical protein